LRRLEAQFDALDADGNGTISAQELVQAFQETLGLSADEGSWIFRQLDIDGDTEIHHSEFLTAALGRDLLRREGTVQEVFSRFDLDKDGKIDRKEMLSVLGPTFCGTPTHQIFEELDTNGDSAIDMDEFSCMMSEPVGGFQPEFEPPPACGMGDDVLPGR
jgi:Ca2+-binding EF-hand superfamily protein